MARVGHRGFRASGLASETDSAEGTDRPVSGDQVQQVFGQPIVDAIAAKLGLTPDQARSTLAQLVPALIRAADQAGPASR